MEEGLGVKLLGVYSWCFSLGIGEGFFEDYLFSYFKEVKYRFLLFFLCFNFWDYS